MCTLKLNGIWVDCILGDRPEERVKSQRIRVDVALPIPETACETDRLEDTVDYAELRRQIEKALVEAKCRMIERAARVVWEVIGRRTGGAEAAAPSGIAVTVTKFGAIPGLESASVTYSA